MPSPRTPKLHLPPRVAQIYGFTSQQYVREVRQRHTSVMTSLLQSLDLQHHRRQRHAGFGYKPVTSSATISAVGCGCRASATLCPAHNGPNAPPGLGSCVETVIGPTRRHARTAAVPVARRKRYGRR